ncbi:LCP family protein [Streptococcus agalactiae]
MSRNNYGQLNHHEELRYNYLLKNIHYLNEREKMEFQYLHYKKTAVRPQRRTESPPTNSYYEEPYSDSYYQDDDFYSEPQLTSQGLPIYQEERAPKKKKQRARKEKQRVKVMAPFPPKAITPPRKKKKFKGFLKFIGIILLIVLSGMVFMFVKGMRDVNNGKSHYSPAIIEDFKGKDAVDGTNILILGSDKRVSERSTDARTDTIMVANVGNKDNKVKMVSFMRDLLVNIPNYSTEGYYDMKLNASFNLGEQDNHKGAEYVRQTLKNHFDIDIKYYVMVDFETFADAIDTLFPNGVKINAKFGLVGGQSADSVKVPDDLRMKNGVVPSQKIKVGIQYMDGRTLLNYARFRKDDDGDFGRTQRQQQVMRAIVSQIKDPRRLFTGSAAIGKAYALTSSNLSYSFVLTDGIPILSDAKNGITQMTIPREGDWVDDYDQYGGQGLTIDFAKYKKILKKMGLR